MMAVYQDSLKKRLLQAKVLTLQETNRIARDVLSAVNYLHSNKLCHGDIHDDNVVFDKGNSAVLIDLGSHVSMITGRTVRLVGSSHNMELEEEVSFKTDVWM